MFWCSDQNFNKGFPYFLTKKAKEKGVELVLPTDVVLADAFDNDANTAIASITEIGDNWRGLDIGPDTIQLFQEKINQANTFVWNGPSEFDIMILIMFDCWSCMSCVSDTNNYLLLFNYTYYFYALNPLRVQWESSRCPTLLLGRSRWRRC